VLIFLGWHTVFGIESAIEALYSPPHLSPPHLLLA